jgi:hypothetical protein
MGCVIHDQSQEAKIAALLRERGADGWVSAVELSAISLQYCRAVNGLRKGGLVIENRVEMHGRTRHGFYRIARPVEQVPLMDLGALRWMDPEERA